VISIVLLLVAPVSSYVCLPPRFSDCNSRHSIIVMRNNFDGILLKINTWYIENSTLQDMEIPEIQFC